MSDEQVIRREFPAVLEPTGDGRTLELRIVPYNIVARVRDPGTNDYDEMWMPGAFDKQLEAPQRVDVLVNFEHEPGIANVIGRGTELRDTGDSLDGTFRMLKGPNADTALELVNEKVLTGVSLEAVPLRSEKGEDGVVRRVKARLLNIALARFPAYKEAQVLAVRERPSIVLTEDEEHLFNSLDSSKEELSEAIDKLLQRVVENERKLTPDEQAEMTKLRDQYEQNIAIKVGRKLTDEEARELQEEWQKANPAVKSDQLAARKVDEALDRVGYEPWSKRTADEMLARVGYEPLVKRAVVRKPWDGSPARFTDEEYKRSCLIDRGGDAPVKERCSLPVLEPNGDLNANALGAAAAALAGARGGLRNVSAEQKASAARKLRRYYSMADMEPPPSMISMAGR